MEWRPISGFEGYYEVSDTGLVKSLERRVQSSNGRVNKISEKIIKSSVNNRGYTRVSLNLNGRGFQKTIHRLVLEAFRPNPDPLIFNHINHIDENKQNNNLSNLEWMEQKDNVLIGQGVHYVATGPDGTSYEFQGLAKFCREHGLDQRKMSRIATGNLSPLSGEAGGWNFQYANGIRTVGAHKRPKKV